jgi:shikimate dehydrogenase
MQAERTFRLGLTGWPLGHSLSPRLHQAALTACRLEGEYHLYPVPPEDPAGLAALVEKIRRGELHGLNVTIPYKVDILALADRLSAAAEAIGAANTLSLTAGQVTADNTDADGFLADLQVLFPGLLSAAVERTALVLGSGGAARAAVYALLQAGWEVVVASRSLERGRRLAGSFERAGVRVPVVELAPAPLAALVQSRQPALVVNATPAGMAPQVEISPWPEGVPLPENAAVYDLIYAPGETRLVKMARSRGRPAHSGLGMLVEQAARAFEIWTGCRPSRETLFNAVDMEAAQP